MLGRQPLSRPIVLSANGLIAKSFDETLARWLDQGSDAEGGDLGHGADSPTVPLSAALITGSLGPAPLLAAP